jgi:4-carboxymuconolactone decarboxylase
MEQSRNARGLALLDQLDGANGREVVAQMGDVGRYVVDFGFGDIYSRPGLSLRDRELAAVAMLVAMGGHEQQVRFHLGAAMNVGLSSAELEEVILQTVPFAGFPPAMNASALLKEVVTERSRTAQGQATEMDAPSFLGVRHIGLLANDPAGLAEFYRDIMGMTLVRQTNAEHALGGTVFLSRHPDQEDHDIVLVSNDKAVHTAFRVASLADLLAFYKRLKDRGIAIQNCFNHVISVAVYFQDPESNVIEVYWVTGRTSSEARADPIDLNAPEEQIRRTILPPDPAGSD